ncbi:MAG: D-tyrosyl-tRNA(Tyr) deacylase [Bradymonadaceae bacterium]|nr:D-tyrosyl-tRNA(Tyr) deacylase [Lujinxingiaceae bacterium]
MRALIQRVSRAKVTVGDQLTGQIGQGILLLLGAGSGDEEKDVDYLLEKTLNLRIFADAEAKMNLSLLDIGASLLVVSQFTLYGDTRKGRRPSFVQAMEPVRAEELYELFVTRARARGVHVECGRFGAMMDVELVNDGPVTLMLESP